MNENGKSTLELTSLQERLFRLLLWIVPISLSVVMAAIVPLSVWLVQNAYMAQSTAVLVREMAVELKEQRVTIRELPPAEWKSRITRLEDSERANVDAHTRILVSLEQIKVAVGAKTDGK